MGASVVFFFAEQEFNFLIKKLIESRFRTIGDTLSYQICKFLTHEIYLLLTINLKNQIKINGIYLFVHES